MPFKGLQLKKKKVHYVSSKGNWELYPKPFYKLPWIHGVSMSSSHLARHLICQGVVTSVTTASKELSCSRDTALAQFCSKSPSTSMEACFAWKKKRHFSCNARRDEDKSLNSERNYPALKGYDTNTLKLQQLRVFYFLFLHKRVFLSSPPIIFCFIWSL